jgi:tetratricopeptide (TPR) repeat protein
VKLVTLGGLQIAGVAFNREKLLLLLAYLALEGHQTRRALAELFWPSSTNPLNSLAVALMKLRRLEALQVDADRVWTELECDAMALKAALRSGQWQQGIDLYVGPFVHGMPMEDIDNELEDWVFSQRESLAREVRQAHVLLAEKQAGGGHFLEAARLGELAHQVPGAPPLDPEEFPRIHRLLLAGEHPSSEHLAREARELNIRLSDSVQAARGRLRQGLAGRARELETLLALEPGQWAWVHGGAGMGKTALLQEVQNRSDCLYLPARSGLPYATLEPILETLNGGEDALLRQVAQADEHLLLDGWEQIDPESQRILLRLRALRPHLRIVVSGVGEPPFLPDRLIELEALQIEELTDHPGAFEATAGLPSLVGAWLRGEPLQTALGTRMLALPVPTQQVFLALALLEAPDLSLVRQSLGLNSLETAQAINDLLSSGLIDLHGNVFGRDLALQHLADRPTLEAKLSLGLARLLKPQQALPLYRKARALLEDADEAPLVLAYQKLAHELIQRGFPKRAAEELEDAPTRPELTLLRARAFEQAGMFKASLETMRFLPDTPEHLALRASLYHRLGKPQEAKTCAEQALLGGVEARAEAHNTLGSISFAEGDFQAAATAFRRAAALWLGLGDQNRRLGTLSNLALMRSNMGEDVEADFKEVLEAAKDNTQVLSHVLINWGREYERQQRLPQALERYREAEQIAVACGDYYLMAMAQNNAGALLFNQQKFAEAKSFYLKAIASARESGEVRVLAMAMANLAEVNGDTEAWAEAITLLEDAGYEDEAALYRQDLMAFQGRLT